MKKQTAADKKIIELTETIALKNSISETDEAIIELLKEQVKIAKGIIECNSRMDSYNKGIIASLRTELDECKPNSNGFAKGIIIGGIVVSVIYFIIDLSFSF